MSQIIFRERATPSTPASGQLSLFANNSGDLSWIDDAGVTNVVATLASNTFTGVQILPAGSVTDPSLTTTGDTNTGIYFPGADRMAFTTGGVIRGSWTTDGLCFGTDTAAANALDDYEEGTWTMGVAFGGASVGVTYANNTGTYTKIGRLVTISGYLQLTSKGTSTGTAAITGLPLAVGATVSFISGISIGQLIDVTFADFPQAYAAHNTTRVPLIETTNAGVFTNLTNADFSNTSQIAIGGSYFV